LATHFADITCESFNEVCERDEAIMHTDRDAANGDKPPRLILPLGGGFIAC
jgi:hypothetical protein